MRSVATQYQEMVCYDSCVEFFVQPEPHLGYFNFEFNRGGTMLIYYIEMQLLSAARSAAYAQVPDTGAERTYSNAQS
jgi:hypothetical protein